MDTERANVIEVELVDNLEYANARLAVEGKRAEVRAATAEAEVLAIRANNVVLRIKEKLGLNGEHEPEVRDGKLVFVRHGG
jgi:hypothetical protein